MPEPANRDDSVAIELESIQTSRGARLFAMSALRGPEVRINDFQMAPIALLHAGDQIRVNSGPAYEIALFHKPAVGPAKDHQVGRMCPVCLGSVETGVPVLECGCGAVFHLETEGEAPLECALAITECSQCQQPLQLEQGYQPEPEFLSR
ncbi:MAG: hypothetical protein HKN23_07480 [Verrucomicrobiales bacterium]|nr:hypothetical protein [Verrucomicrobiales bacterium]